jgi:UDP-N-acetyl-D-glucosamine dehydrogenase
VTGTADATPAETLAKRVADRSARICVVGLGYVGLPTAVAFAEAGFSVIGVEVNSERCSAINAGRSHVADVPDTVLQRLLGAGRLRAVADISEAGDCDVFDICVPTPLGKSRDPDMSAILAAAEALRTIIRRGQLVVLTSTTYPGTTTEILRPILESGGLRVGHDVFLAFAPERIDPGNQRFRIQNTPKVVGGATASCTELAQQVFATIVDQVVPVSSSAAAEMTKLLENVFRSVNIALANELAIMCRRLEIDVWEVIDAASSKPYGFMPFYPGPGLGGHCIPVDPGYLSWKMRRLNYVARFIELAEDINGHMPEYVVQRVSDILNTVGKSIQGSRILLLGVAYKADVDDVRESPAVDILSLLMERGGNVAFCDPHVEGGIDVNGTSLRGEGCTAETLAAQDLVVVTTPHHAFDRDLVADHARLVLDTRGWGRGHPTAEARWQTL